MFALVALGLYLWKWPAACEPLPAVCTTAAEGGQIQIRQEDALCRHADVDSVGSRLRGENPA